LAKTILAVVVAVLMAAPRTGAAQEAVVQGPGYKVAEGTVLHPSAAVAAGYISNVFFESTENESPSGAAVVRVLAGLDVASRPEERLTSMEPGVPSAEPRLEFRGGLELQYEEYLSSNDAIVAQRNLTGQASARGVLFPKGPHRFTAAETFSRVTRPVNFESSENLDRHINEFSLSYGFFPQERTIDANIAYKNLIDAFVDGPEFADRFHHTLAVQANWRYLPVTRLFAQVSQSWFTQWGDATLPNGEQVGADAYPLRIELGIGTAVTELTTLRLSAGFAAGLYQAGPSYASWIFNAEFGYRYSPLGRFVVTAARDFSDSINANYFLEQKVGAQIQQAIDRVLATVGVDVRLRDYEGVPAALGAASRADAIVQFRADARYELRERLAATAGYLLTIDQTNFEQIDGGVVVDDPSYIRHEATVAIHAAF
jgi:hypothetical protein